MNTGIENNDLSRLLNMVENINSRLTAIESKMNLSKTEIDESNEPDLHKKEQESSEDIEFRFGEKWFGKIGIIAFLLAVFNFLVLPFESVPSHIILFAGYFISIALILTSTFGEKFLKNLSGYTMGSGLILLFVTTLRLHFFSAEPLLSSKPILIFLLYLVSTFSVLISLKRNSIYLAILSELFLYGSTLISNYPILIFIALIGGALIASYLEKKYNWDGLSIFAILLTFIVHLLWYLNNPAIGNEMMIVPDWKLNLLFIPVYMIVFGSTNVNKGSDEIDDFPSLLKTLFNAFGGFGLFLFISFNSNHNYLGVLNFGLSIILLFLASLHWTKQKSKFSTFVYSMLAYAALSVAIVFTFSSPDYFIWLCWQSLAVVSTALWFRSKFIVVTNFFIFILIFLVYLTTNGTEIPLYGLSFGIVALISARIMNWQKERLELKTDNLRIAYLVVAFLLIPFVLYLNIPSQFVGITYILLALIYYYIGKIINNKKYRLMASGTLILSLIYILIFGLTSSNTTYKIISFLVVSIALVVISTIYARTKVIEKGNA